MIYSDRGVSGSTGAYKEPTYRLQIGYMSTACRAFVVVLNFLYRILPDLLFTHHKAPRCQTASPVSVDNF